MKKKCIWTESGIKEGIEYSHTQYFVYNDGGRNKAGFKGHTSDCVVRAISIVTGKNYTEVYNEINDIAKTERITKSKPTKSSARTGVHKATIRKYMAKIGWTWIPTMSIGSGCKVHLRGDELPSGKIMVNVSKHSVAVIDGVIHDTYDSSRGGNRCVYGYFKKL